MSPTTEPGKNHPLDDAVRLEPLGDGRWRGATSPAYWGAIGPYGGITAATLLNAVVRHPDRLGDPLSLTVNYAGPVREGGFIVETRCVRSNRTTQHWSIELVQPSPQTGEREVAASAIAVFALRRDTFSHTEVKMPAAPAPENCARQHPHIDVAWIQRYDIRYVRGRPMVRGDDSVTHSWVADDPPRPLDHVALASICDVFFPRLFIHRPTFVPIGTVSMNIYFHAGSDELSRHGTRHVMTAAHGQVCDGGFYDHQGQVWGGPHQLLATTHQIVWFKQ